MIKKLKAPRSQVSFHAKVPQQISLRALILLLTDSSSPDKATNSYILRQCTKEQANQYKRIQKKVTALQELDLPADSNSSSPSSDIVFSNTPLPAMDELIRLAEDLQKNTNEQLIDYINRTAQAKNPFAAVLSSLCAKTTTNT